MMAKAKMSNRAQKAIKVSSEKGPKMERKLARRLGLAMRSEKQPSAALVER